VLLLPGGQLFDSFRFVVRAAVTAAVVVLVFAAQPNSAQDVYALPQTGNMADFRGQNGATGVFQVTGADDGRVYGTEIYTDDSDVPTAAVHAGLVRVGETRNLKIRILGGKASYRGSSSHGVVSYDFGGWVGSYAFVDTPALDLPSEVTADPGTLRGYRGQVGQTLSFVVTGAVRGRLYGDGVYTDDSDLAFAAVHAGLLRPGEQGTVAVVIMPGQKRYAGAQRNNVSSREYGETPGSFRFAGTPAMPEGVPPDPGNMSAYRGFNGQVFQFAVVGSGDGSIYGDGTYTDDTRLASAAVHAGILRDGEAGVVNVQILPGQESYDGSTRNGVTSRSYGRWQGSFQFLP
jgi:LCCL domain